MNIESIAGKKVHANDHLAQSAVMAMIAAALLSLAACSKPDAAAPAPRPALAYTIAAGAGSETELYAGEIRARYEVDHAFRVGGKIIQRVVDAGATVKKGQPLARLDPQDVRLSADAARAQVAAQQADTDFATSELTRYQDLFAKGFISKSALDQKLNAANAAKARLAAQRAQADVSINQAGYATLVAELDGVVTQVNAEAGQVVSAGQAVMKIADPKEKELLISAPESKIGEFKAAAAKAAGNKETQAANLRVALWSQPGKYYAARIREIGGAADAVTRTYPVRLTIQAADEAIQLGMTAYSVFGSANESTTLAVPLSSLYVKAGVTGVWLIAADGKVSLKPVTVLQYRETTAFIKPEAGGVKAGDVIVAAGVHKLRDGEVVKPIRDPLVTGDGKVAYIPAEPGAPAVAQQ